jgi:NAD-specific glutamate dehydrogenase
MAPKRVDILNAPEDWRGEATTLIKIYHHERSLVLSDILPMLENLGFRVLEQISYAAEPPGELLGIDIFRVHDQ